jgi:hypothetical protein
MTTASSYGCSRRNQLQVPRKPKAATVNKRPDHAGSDEMVTCPFVCVRLRVVGRGAARPESVAVDCATGRKLLHANQNDARIIAHRKPNAAHPISSRMAHAGGHHTRRSTT